MPTILPGPCPSRSLAAGAKPRSHPSGSHAARATRRIELGQGALAVAPVGERPKGCVHFLGGAFAGAAPYLAYSLLIDRVADSGYTVVATPYAVTFRHDQCARAASAAFVAALAELRADRALRWAVPPGLPLHGVGHSNGALLHLLAASLCAPAYASAALLSFNNRQVGDAVPVPLSPAQAAVQGVVASLGGQTLEQAASQAAQAAVSSLLGVAQAAGLADAGAQLALRQLQPALTQLGSVFDEVGAGQLDFTPSPEQTRRLVRERYAVRRTLLVRFADDAIDQTAELAELLRGRGGGGGVAELALPGTHVTPLGAAPQWRAGGAFTPADALAQAVLSVAQADVRRLADRLIAWLDANSAAVL